MRSNLKRRSVDVGSNIVSFGALGVIRPCRPIRYDEPRGQVLLFTGVRYDYPIVTPAFGSITWWQTGSRRARIPAKKVRAPPRGSLRPQSFHRNQTKLSNVYSPEDDMIDWQTKRLLSIVVAVDVLSAIACVLWAARAYNTVSNEMNNLVERSRLRLIGDRYGPGILRRCHGWSSSRTHHPLRRSRWPVCLR